MLEHEKILILPLGSCRTIHDPEEAPLAQEICKDPVVIQQGLAKVRNRRWILWAVILIYMPCLIVALEMEATGGTLGTLFFIWLVLLCIAVGLATVVRCPRCGNTYHTNGPTFLPVRKCVHCGLAVNADKKK
jgi:hypothetical protein